ncbi:MAG: PLP-dependent aminotransferase family protein [Pseudomonadota bacterium]
MQPHLRLHLDLDSSRPLGAAEIATAIGKGVVQLPYADGARLPPVRVLAHQLGVSKNTIAAAYDELVARGIIASEERRGFFLAGPPDRAVESPEWNVAPPRVRPATLAELPSPRGTRGKRDGVIHLNNVFVDPDLLPRERIADCLRSVLRAPGIHTFYDAQGHLPLRMAIAKRLQARGIPARAEHVIITTGSQQALDIVCRALQRRSIATENPAYAIGKRLFEMNGVETVGLPFDPFTGIDLQRWKDMLSMARPSLLYLTSSFQNPTGYSYSTHELSSIVQLASELGFGILEDDWGSDMLSFSEFRPPLRSLGGEGVLYMNSFTKKLLPSLRIGFLLANDACLDSLIEAKRVATLANPTLIEAALAEFLDRGYFDAHLKAMQEELDRRYSACLEILRHTMPEGVRWTTPGGGPLLWLELPRSVDLSALRERLAQGGVAVLSSEESFFGAPHLHGFRIGYAYPKTAELERGLRTVAAEIQRQLAR